jgi:prepilin-type N-terminal cleavage/methylation domain-containing protein
MNLSKQKKKLLHRSSFILYPNSGFTLVELLIVIIVVGILAGTGIYTFKGSQEKARDAQRKTDLQNIKKALLLFFNDKQTFPVGGCIGSGCSTLFSYGGATSSDYITDFPVDPINAAPYRYGYASDGTCFYLLATLENTKDPQGNMTYTKCGTTLNIPSTYYVFGP